MKVRTLFIILALVSGSVFAENMDCPTPRKTGPGSFPLDYNDLASRGHMLAMVEGAHFNINVEQLSRGETGQLPGPDLSYVLNAYPNHPRALNAMTRLALLEKTGAPAGVPFTVECFLQRAIAFAPNDRIPYLIYGNYLSKMERYPEALEKYKEAEKLDPDNANTLYNMGLTYFNLGQYDQALVYAKKAYAENFPLPGLRQKLKDKGVWSD